MSRSWSLDLGDPVVADQSAQRILPWQLECSRSLNYHRSSSSQFPSCLALEALLLYREHLSAFILYISSCIALLYFFGDVILLYYCITLCDNHELLLFCWNIYYHCASALWFLPVLILNVYTWGYFRPAYIRRSGVSVPVGPGRHRLVLEPRL